MDLDKKQTAIFLSTIGYSINKSFKFKIRDEKIPSASIDPKNGKIKDFGSGWYGDVVDFLVAYHGFNKKEAFKKVSNILGKNLEFEFKPSYKISKDFVPITQDIIDKFKLERKENFKEYWKKLSKTIKHPSNEIKKNIAIEYEIGYSKISNRLIMPIRDIEGKCISFCKYDPDSKSVIGKDGKVRSYPKVMFSKERGRIAFNFSKINIYRNQNEPIYICEGEKDCLNAIAFGFNAITLGSASSHLTSKNLELFSGLNVIIAYDFDKAGQNGAQNLKNILKDVCNVKILNWKMVSTKFKIDKNLKEGFDFRDCLALLVNK